MSVARIGLIASAPATANWLAALSRTEDVALAAICDADPVATREIAGRIRCEAFDDPRVLLVRSELDGVILAHSPAAHHKLLPVIAERRLPVLIDAPACRRLDEAAAHVREFAAQRVPHLVSSAWRCDDALSPLQDAEALLGRMLSAYADVTLPMPEELGWRGDQVAAGGGVLACGAYEAVDLLVAAMGVPDDVVAAVARTPWTTRTPYDVEDRAAVLLRYASRREALLRASWGGGPKHWSVRLVGVQRTALIDAETVATVRSCDGSIDAPPGEAGRRRAAEEDARIAMLRQLRAMLSAERPASAGRPAMRSTLHDHLPTAAVIETAYLSARTGAPESPRRLMERICPDLTAPA